MNNGYLNNKNKELNKNGCNTYGSYGRPIGDGGDPAVVAELCEKNTDEVTSVTALVDGMAVVLVDSIGNILIEG